MIFEESRLLLTDARDLLQEINEIYNNSLQEKNIPKVLPLKIKKFIDSTRSSLDYIAFHVFTVYCTKYFDSKKIESAEKKVYFPIRESLENFNKFIRTVFKGLESDRPELVDLFKRYQPFPSSNPSLKYLNELANTNKHRNLTPQRRQDSSSVNFHSSDGGHFIFQDCYIESGSININGNPLLMDRRGQLPLPGQNLKNLVVFKWVSFHFSDLNLEVMSTLTNIFNTTVDIINDFEEAF